MPKKYNVTKLYKLLKRQHYLSLNKKADTYWKLLFARTEKNCENSADWYCIIECWIKLFGKDGLKQAELYASNAQKTVTCSVDCFAASGAWELLALIDPHYKAQVRECLIKASTIDPSAEELCFCAYEWINIFGVKEKKYALHLMNEAEKRYQHCWECGDIITYWVKCFGEYGRKRAIRFLQKNGNKVSLKSDQIVEYIAEPCLEILKDWNLYAKWMERARKVERRKK